MATVQIDGVDKPVSLVRVVDGSGNGTDAVTGAVDDAAVTDPSNDGTVIALLKGILTALNSIDTKTPAA